MTKVFLNAEGRIKLYLVINGRSIISYANVKNVKSKKNKLVKNAIADGVFQYFTQGYSNNKRLEDKFYYYSDDPYGKGFKSVISELNISIMDYDISYNKLLSVKRINRNNMYYLEARDKKTNKVISRQRFRYTRKLYIDYSEDE